MSSSSSTAAVVSDPVASDPEASAPVALGPVAFDPAGRWELDPRVAVRPEPFGALLYHFGTRKLSFLKNTTVVTVVRSLSDHPTADAAIAAAVPDPAARAVYVQALSSLADSAMIRPAVFHPSEQA